MTTIMICEKPDAAKKIAYAIADDKVKHIKSASDIVYYEFTKNKEKHIAVPAVGHIFGLKDTSGKGWNYPIFDLDWAPAYEINAKAAFSKKYFEAIQEAAKQGDKFIVATDLDEEGSVIGYNILRYICKKEDAMRMSFSTLTKQDLVEAYDKLSKHLDFSRIESGLTRHMLDYLWGINVTRALTLSIKHFGKKLKYHVLSAGRVQTPMLYFLIKREKEIGKFKPVPFWEIDAQIGTDPKVVAHHTEDKFWDENKAKEIHKKCKGKKAKINESTRKNVEKKPPFPFDLTTLQTEAYRFFGFSPKRTVSIAQNLYTAGYISYPRTSSQKLPPQIGYKNILEHLSKIKPYEKLCQKLLALKELKPNEGPKEDAAHPAVYPTSEQPELKDMKPEERKLYDLIARRFMATFGEPAIRESITIDFDIAGELFRTTGSRTIEKKWMEFYGPYAKLEEADFPDVVEGQEYAVEKLDLLSKETQPPSRYSQGSIVRELEKHNLGTKTTRATILQTLYDRGYIEDKSIEVTTLGMKVGETLAEYTPELVSEELTRDFEESMAKVEQGKAKKETIMKQARTVITKVSEEFKQNEQKLGETLEDAVIEMQNKKQLLGPCPNCGGELKVLFSPWTKKKFVGCSSYTKCKLCGFTKKACKCKCPICGGLKGKCKCEWKLKVWNPTCGTGFPLPSRGLIESTEKICEQCRTPIIKVIRKGARPFTMCLDPKCKTKEGWLKTPEELEKIKQKKEAAEAKEEAKAVKAEVKVEAKAEPKPAAEKSKKARKKSR